MSRKRPFTRLIDRWPCQWPLSPPDRLSSEFTAQHVDHVALDEDALGEVQAATSSQIAVAGHSNSDTVCSRAVRI